MGVLRKVAILLLVLIIFGCTTGGEPKPDVQSGQPAPNEAPELLPLKKRQASVVAVNVIDGRQGISTIHRKVDELETLTTRLAAAKPSDAKERHDPSVFGPAVRFIFELSDGTQIKLDYWPEHGDPNLWDPSAERWWIVSELDEVLIAMGHTEPQSTWTLQDIAEAQHVAELYLDAVARKEIDTALSLLSARYKQQSGESALRKSLSNIGRLEVVSLTPDESHPRSAAQFHFRVELIVESSDSTAWVQGTNVRWVVLVKDEGLWRVDGLST